MHSTGNIIADTICCTAELGLAITGTSDAGEFTLIEADAPPIPIDALTAITPAYFATTSTGS